jgi:hypothetical protein
MINFLSKLTSVTGVVLAVTVMNIPAIQAATVTYQFQGITDNGAFPFPNESYSGLFRFDESGLTNSYTGTLPVSTVHFTFLGTNFTEANAAATPLVSFDNGTFLGLNFSANTANFSFSFIPGSTDATDAYFSYLDANQQSGAGDVTYNRVNGGQNSSIPEPSSVLSLLGLGLLGISLMYYRQSPS